MYWAHSDRNGKLPSDAGANWQPLRTHLLDVGELAESLALAAGGSEEFSRRARAAGLLHDIGKYSDSFQQLLFGQVKKAPHSIFGAATARFQGRASDVAFAVAGHHAGIPDISKLDKDTRGEREKASQLWRRAVTDFPAIAACFEGANPLLGSFSSADPLVIDLHCRMLLSCLVDADRLNTAASAGEQRPESQSLRAAQLLKALLEKISERAAETEEGAVKAARRQVLEECLEAASRPGSLFSLTVPTGGGKTFSSMAFALRRAVLDPSVRRIIVVIPFLSIIEQNAKAYRDAFGEDVILEHHSGAFSSGETTDEKYANPAQRPEFENWDAPIVVTTSVRFFECLFSNHPRDLRRFHNIASSIVILDEVQTLPRKFVATTLSVLKGMADAWQTTFVFSTATQPALEQSGNATAKDPRFPSGTLGEIIKEPALLFAGLRRVNTEWRSGEMSWGEVAAEVGAESQALVIVNTRGAAIKLYNELRRLTADCLHLSNNMCPVHRLERLKLIRDRVGKGLPCIVVATQLVEAGVDIDFPVVWRALGPLDSIAQAAGRCDRGGLLTERAGRPSGRLVVFEPVEAAMPPGAYKEGADIARVMRKAGSASWDDPGTIRAYFDRFYQGGENLDPQGVQRMRREYEFARVASEVKWIEDETKSVLIPYNESARELIQEIRFAGVSLNRFRQAQQFTVSLWPHQLTRAKAIGSAYELAPGTQLWACREGLYAEDLGIQYEGTGHSI
jgi:CRISPR-associated endonuclease/helicase Cas3